MATVLLLLVVASEFSLIFTRLNQEFPLPLGFIVYTISCTHLEQGSIWIYHLSLTPSCLCTSTISQRNLMILMILMKGTPLHHNKDSSRPLGPRADCTMGHIKDYLAMRIWASPLARMLDTVILVGSNLHIWTQYGHLPFGNCQMKNSLCFFKMGFGINQHLWYCFLPVFSHFLLSLPSVIHL